MFFVVVNARFITTFYKAGRIEGLLYRHSQKFGLIVALIVIAAEPKSSHMKSSLLEISRKRLTQNCNQVTVCCLQHVEEQSRAHSKNTHTIKHGVLSKTRSSTDSVRYVFF